MTRAFLLTLAIVAMSITETESSRGLLTYANRLSAPHTIQFGLPPTGTVASSRKSGSA